ncbi:MAG: hypothetical protein JO339_26705 [Alphaproteobacteria bacterium]|nr:hypothetical protein [Alphaproteobacteria bacterium]
MRPGLAAPDTGLAGTTGNTIGNQRRGVAPGPQLAHFQQSPGFRPPPPMPVPHLSFLPPSRGPSLSLGLGTPASKPAGKSDPGVQAQVAAILQEPSMQANPSTSAAGMLAGTNPDVGVGGGIGGGMPQPPHGGSGGSSRASSGVGTSPYAGLISPLVQTILRRNPYLQWFSR